MMAGAKKKIELPSHERMYFVENADWEGVHFFLETADPEPYQGTEIYEPWKKLVEAHKELQAVLNKYREELNGSK